MSRKLRLRWNSDDPDELPAIGHYLVPMGPRCRAAYLILGIDDRGPRGGLGVPVYTLYVVAVERVPRAEAMRGPYMAFAWDRRPTTRRAMTLAELAQH